MNLYEMDEKSTEIAEFLAGVILCVPALVLLLAVFVAQSGVVVVAGVIKVPFVMKDAYQDAVGQSIDDCDLSKEQKQKLRRTLGAK